MASESYEKQRNAKEAVAVWTAKVSFPAFEDLPAKDFFWSTSDIEVDNENYTRKLTAVPKGRHQADRGNDYVQFDVGNPNNAVHQDIYLYEDLIERANVRVKECYEIDKGYFESETRFRGFLKDYSVDESDKILKFTAISDLSRTGFQVGNRILTRERCGTEFNFNGLNAPEFHPCGWQTAQGGNPLFCSKLLKGVDGCIAHNNSHRFYAIKGLSNAEVQIITTSQSGFDYGSGSACFVTGTFVVLADWSIKKIEDVKPGDYVLGFDVFTDRLCPTKVLANETKEVTETEKGYLGINSDFTTFGVTRDHLFSKGSGIFKAFIANIGETVQGIGKDGKRAEISVIDSETVFGKQSVHHLQTECGTHTVCDKNLKIIAKVHNLKAQTVTI